MNGEYRPSSRDRLRRWARRRLLEQLRSLVEADGLRLLDLGGGTGVTTVVFGAGARERVVLEPDERRILKGQRAHAPITFVAGVAEAIPFGDGRFDRVVSLMSFHHFSNGEKACREAARVLAPGGRLIVYDIHRSSLMARWLSLFVRRRGHSAVGFATPEGLEQLVSAAGLRVARREAFRSGTFVVGERGT